MKHALLFSLLLLGCGCNQKSKVPTIEYFGEHFRLNHSFDDYDQYKEDPGNIHSNEIDRIEAKILSINISKEFKTRNDFILAAIKIKFPGFGLGGLDSPSNIYTAAIEIPQKKIDRYITAIERNGHWFVIDDFAGPSATGGSTVQIEKEELIYRNHIGLEFRRRRVGP